MAVSRSNVNRNAGRIVSHMDLSAVYDYVDAHLDRFIAELRELCLIPSVGGDDAGMAEAERWLRQWEKFWNVRLDRLEALIESDKSTKENPHG